MALFCAPDLARTKSKKSRERCVGRKNERKRTPPKSTTIYNFCFENKILGPTVKLPFPVFVYKTGNGLISRERCVVLKNDRKRTPPKSTKIYNFCFENKILAPTVQLPCAVLYFMYNASEQAKKKLVWLRVAPLRTKRLISRKQCVV